LTGALAHGIDALVVFRLVAARFRLCSRFLGWLWLLLQFLVACCDFCATFCDFLWIFLTFSCFLGFVVFCCLFAAVCLPFRCRVLSFYCPFNAFCCLSYSFFWSYCFCCCRLPFCRLVPWRLQSILWHRNSTSDPRADSHPVIESSYGTIPLT
jgi:hypothetical protein